MIKKIKVKEDYQIDESVARRYTPIKDIKAIIYLTKMCDGNILEIGCNEGVTTNELCKFNPNKKIYAVDYIDSTNTMSQEQRKETPQKIGHLIHKNCNVKIINKSSQELDFFELEDVGFIFIDGDHSFEAVKKIPKNPLNTFSKEEKE